jgi:hypothetical protein
MFCSVINTMRATRCRAGSLMPQSTHAVRIARHPAAESASARAPPDRPMPSAAAAASAMSEKPGRCAPYFPSARVLSGGTPSAARATAPTEDDVVGAPAGWELPAGGSARGVAPKNSTTEAPQSQTELSDFAVAAIFPDILSHALSFFLVPVDVFLPEEKKKRTVDAVSTKPSSSSCRLQRPTPVIVF